MSLNTWVRKTSERPYAHRMRGVKFHYGKDGKMSHVTALNPKPSTIEQEALKRAKEGK
jgi:hypothetical protein